MSKAKIRWVSAKDAKAILRLNSVEFNNLIDGVEMIYGDEIRNGWSSGCLFNIVFLTQLLEKQKLLNESSSL